MPVQTAASTELVEISAASQRRAVVGVDNNGIPKLGNPSIRGARLTADVRISTWLAQKGKMSSNAGEYIFNYGKKLICRHQIADFDFDPKCFELTQSVFTSGNKNENIF